MKICLCHFLDMYLTSPNLRVDKLLLCGPRSIIGRFLARYVLHLVVWILDECQLLRVIRVCQRDKSVYLNACQRHLQKMTGCKLPVHRRFPTNFLVE